jgi:hypothetical protein
VKSWFDVYFLILPAEYIGFPFIIFSQLTRCLIVLFKLSTLDDPAWDKSFVRNTADVILILNQAIFNLRQVNWLAKLEDDNPEVNVFSRGADSYEAIRMRWEVKVAETDTSTPQSCSVRHDRDIPNAPRHCYHRHRKLMTLLCDDKKLLMRYIGHSRDNR